MTHAKKKVSQLSSRTFVILTFYVSKGHVMLRGTIKLLENIYLAL